MACGATVSAISSKSLASIRSTVVQFYATSNVAGTQFYPNLHHGRWAETTVSLHHVSTFVRVRTALINEEELANAIFSAQDVLGSITEFTVILDDRKPAALLAFLVEIDGELCEICFPFPSDRRSVIFFV